MVSTVATRRDQSSNASRPTHRLFATASAASLDQSRLSDARREGDINAFVSDFEDATAWFRERYDDRQAVAADTRELIDCASSTDNFMRRRKLYARARRDWDDLRLDLDQLERYYKVSWRSDASPSG